MPKIFEKRTLKINYLIGITGFCLLAFVLGLISFVYDVVLLGFVFGQGVSAATLTYSLISFVIPGCFLPFLIKSIVRINRLG